MLGRENASQRVQTLEAAAVETATALAEKDRVLDATQTQLALQENEVARLQAEMRTMTSSVEELESKLKAEMAKKHSDDQRDSEAGDENIQVYDCTLFFFFFLLCGGGKGGVTVLATERHIVVTCLIHSASMISMCGSKFTFFFS